MSNKNNYQSKIENLVKENAQKYYTDGTQHLSDNAFDALIEELKQLDPENELLTKIGWGYKIDKTKDKVKHKYCNIGSMPKVRNWDEIKTIIASKTKPNNFTTLSLTNGINIDEKAVVITAKLDGMSVVLYYIKGKLDLALTRGDDDGEYGVDITEKVKFLIGDNIDDKTFTGAIRGEIKMTPDDFEKYKQNNTSMQISNHRNSAIGLINGDKITENYKYLSLYVYSIIAVEDSHDKNNAAFKILTASNQRKYTHIVWLTHNFTNVVPVNFPSINDFNSSNYLEYLNNEKSIYEKEVNIDGIVISCFGMKYDKNTNCFNNIDVAFKFQEEEKLTTVTGIEWNMSKNSELIPVVLVEPITLSNTTVKRATGYNAKYILENNIGKNCMLTIAKRGEIIPNIRDIIDNNMVEMNIPTHCEHCNSELVWNSVHLVCDNMLCDQKAEEKLKHWCLNLAPVEGLGFKTIKNVLLKYYNMQRCTISEFMLLDYIVDAVGEAKLFNNMLKILKENKFTLSQFLNALNIPGLGKISTLKIEQSEQSEEIFNMIIDYKKETILATSFNKLNYLIQDINTTSHILSLAVAKSIYDAYIILDKRIIFNNNQQDIIKDEMTEKNRNVVITGKLSIKRQDFERILRLNGWKLQTSVTNTTNYLITDTPNSNTTKNKKAEELNVIKISEKDFLNMLRNN